MKEKHRVLSLFSGCGGMDIGFEGGFRCLKRSVNTEIHPDWIDADAGEWVTVTKTGFKTVFANDIRPDAKSAWVSYFGRIYSDANDIYHVESIVDLVKKARAGEKVFPDDIDVVTGDFLVKISRLPAKEKDSTQKKAIMVGSLMWVNRPLKAEDSSICG